ncbi:MAG: extracellular solute-binding protein [Acetobacteraceae bacterium]|nr:extracellular solute-binding protein [Acetobacteraceae bacterium]
MGKLSRRSVLRSSVGLAAGGILARPYIANAAATTATLWQVQGFVPEEDAAFRKVVADYQKATGNKIDYSIMPFMALNQKAISALTSGDVPDLIFHDAPATILPQNAWNDKLEDVSDVVEPQKSKLNPTALECSSFYNSAVRSRNYYLCPVKLGTTPFHVWGDLIAKADLKLSDAPDTWDAFWDFFKQTQKPLRAKGMRKVYALGLQVTTVGPNDSTNLYQHFLVANGGGDIVTKDGKLHTDDPAVREAAIKTTTWLSAAYKDGYVPPEALSWNDADDNNGFHEKLFVMDLDGTISTEVALIHNKKAYFEEMVTLGLPKRNDGNQMRAFLGAGGGFIPKGAKNVEAAKDFMKYFMQPEVMNANLREGLGRWVPAITELTKTDPFWLDPADPHRKPYVEEAIGPSRPTYNAFNPAWGQVEAEQLAMQTVADVVKNGMTPKDAVDKAFKRAEAIFTKYTFA